MTRARWIALGVLLGLLPLIPYAWAQGGPGLFVSAVCATLPNPVAGATWCFQSSPPRQLYVYNGTTFVPPVASYLENGVVMSSGNTLTAVAQIGASNMGTGPADATTYLRGDQQWVTPAGSAITVNYVYNADFETVYACGTTPCGWYLTGGTGSVSRNTTAGRFNTGAAGVALTRTSGGNVAIYQKFSSLWGNAPLLSGTAVTCGVWAWANVGAAGYIAVRDDTGATFSGAHPGTGQLVFLSATRSITAASTFVAVNLEVSAATTVYYDSVICTQGTVITAWVPSHWRPTTSVVQHTSGAVANAGNGTTTFIGAYQSATEPPVGVVTPLTCIVKNYCLFLSVAPGGATFASATLRRLQTFDSAVTVSVTAANRFNCTAANTDLLETANPHDTRLYVHTGAPATTAIVSILCEEYPPAPMLPA